MSATVETVTSYIAKIQIIRTEKTYTTEYGSKNPTERRIMRTLASVQVGDVDINALLNKVRSHISLVDDTGGDVDE